MRQGRLTHGLKAAAVLGTASLLLAGCSQGPSGDPEEVKEIVVAHAAGINGEAVEKLLLDFTAETGIKATGITMSDTDYGAKMQLAAKSGNPEFDVALGIQYDIFYLLEDTGAFASVDTSGWDAANLAAFESSGLIGENYVVSQDASAFLVYSNALADNPPTSWADFFDTEKYPGNRAMASAGLGVPINLQYALIADGVSPDSVIPIDLDRAYAVLDRLGDALVLWDNAPVGIQSVVNGDAVMTWAYSPATLGAVSSGSELSFTAPPGTAVTRQLGVVMAEAPNSTAAGKLFFDWWFAPEVQAKYTEYTNYGIVVPAATVLEQFTAEQQEFMPFSGSLADNYRVLDYKYFSEVDAAGESQLSKVLNSWSEFRAG